MAALGAAVAFVVINRPQLFGPKPAASPNARHHVLESPYTRQRFIPGQPQGQTSIALGRAQPSSLGRSYRTSGYQWLAVTDANTLTPVGTFKTSGLVAVPGVDAAYSFGHFMAIGVESLEQASTPQVAVDWIRRAGGAGFIARPLQAPAMSYQTIASLDGLDGIQVFDARLAKEDPPRADATALWDRLLTDHHVVWGIVGDDTADDKGADSVVGQTLVDVQVDQVTPSAIADALRRGAFVDSAGVRVESVIASGDSITVVTKDADTIQFIGSGGNVRKQVSGAQADYKVDWTEGYVRVFATNGKGGRAWTQPIVVAP
ncbi:MAG: hypothetical protein WAT58_12845 [Candidatus Dormiibacterota bacterium]